MRIDQRIVKRTKEPNRLRSAKAPVMSAGVIAANISWNIANNMNGIVTAYTADGAWPTPLKKAKSRPPIRPSPLTSGPKASVNPTITQTMLTNARPKKLCIVVDSTFLRRTSPP